MSEQRKDPSAAGGVPDLGTGLWFLAGSAGVVAGSLLVHSGRFERLSGVAEILIAALVGLVTMAAFAPWKLVVGGRRDRRDIQELTRSLRQFERDRGHHPIRAPKSTRPGEVGELRRAVHAALTTASANRLEANQLRRTLDQSIRKETDRATGRLQREAATDPLTGLGNRRALDARAGGLLDACRRDGRPLSALVIDVDLFKQINDQLGHEAGDECLAFLGRLLKAGLRSEDCAFRNGGDEFVVLMPGQGSEVGEKVARRISSLFRQIPWPHNAPGRPTLSIGVATVRPAHRVDPKELLRRADEAMYAAKRSGRATIASDRDMAA